MPLKYSNQSVSGSVQEQIEQITSTQQNAPQNTLPEIQPAQVDETMVAQGEDLIDSVNLNLPELGSEGKTPAGEKIKEFIVQQLGGFDVFKRADEARVASVEEELPESGVNTANQS